MIGCQGTNKDKDKDKGVLVITTDGALVVFTYYCLGGNQLATFSQLRCKLISDVDVKYI